MKYKQTLPINLGFFGEGDPVPPTPPAGGSTENPPPADPPPAPPVKTFTQADIDEIINKKFSQWEVKKAKEIEDARTDAEKLAKMTAEEKAAEAQRKHDEEINSKLADVARRELRIQAHQTLTEKGLPAVLLDALSYTDAESCNKSITAVEAALRAGIEAGVTERLKSAPPKKQDGADSNLFTYEQLKVLKPEQIEKEYDKVMASMAAM